MMPDAMGIKIFVLCVEVGGICGQAQKVKKLVLFSNIFLLCLFFF
jgi:hypothetical protein